MIYFYIENYNFSSNVISKKTRHDNNSLDNSFLASSKIKNIKIVNTTIIIHKLYFLLRIFESVFIHKKIKVHSITFDNCVLLHDWIYSI